MISTFEHFESAERIKVYVGRRSLSMGDDANCPNMFSFYLPSDPSDVVDELYGHGLPTYASWKGYLGKRCPSSSDEDGVQIFGRASDEVIFEIEESSDPHDPTFEFTQDWYRKIEGHPYIYCE